MLQSGLDISPGHHAPTSPTRDFEKGFEPRRPAATAGKVILHWSGLRACTARRAACAGRARRDPRRRAVQGRARDRRRRSRRDVTRRRRARGAELLRQQLSRPGRPPGADRGRAGGARPLGLRHGLGALHLRHAGDPQAARGAALPASSAPRTRSSTAPASTPTAGCSRRCSAPRTRSSPTRSTTPRSSTASACARPSATATRTATWPTSRRSCRRPAAAPAAG